MSLTEPTPGNALFASGDLPVAGTLDIAGIPTYDVGVVVGRFQVDELTRGHRELLNSVIERHDKVIVVLGRAPIPCSVNNPLDVQARTQMIHADFPDVIVTYVSDHPSDEAWCKKLDTIISELIGPNQSVVLYGSRDSFIESYQWGRYPTIMLEPGANESGTVRREIVARVARGVAAWRAGAIWASRQRYANPIPAVDIAIFTPDFSQILLGRKPIEDFYRLPGGMVDMGDRRKNGSGVLRIAAEREAFEETKCRLDNLEYVDSFHMDDWRYRGEPNGIMTSLFIATTTDEPQAGDDLAEVMWRSTQGLHASSHPVGKIHRDLVTAAWSYVNQKGYLK